jgi:hypothetical protein
MFDVEKDLWFGELVIDIMAVVDKLVGICLQSKLLGDEAVRRKKHSKTVTKWSDGEAVAVGLKWG